MKIAFIGQKGIPATGGGVERYVEDLSTRLASKGQEAWVYTRPYYTDKNLTEYRGVRLISLPSIHSKHLDAITHSLLAACHAAWKKADVIHFQSIGSALVMWLPKLINPRVKIVATLQSKDYEHGKWGKFAKFSLKLGERLMCWLADEVVAVTKPMADYIADNYGLEAPIIPNGANLYEAEEADCLAEWNLQPKQYIVAISRLVRHKGLSCLVEAYQQLGEVEMPLVIVGDGAFTDDYVNELKALAGNNDKIIFTGAQTGRTLAQLYSNAYLFVQPSESEGLSLALLEAMARRVPTLVSDIPENLAAVDNTGLIFAVRSVDGLRQQLRFALEEPELLADKAEAGRRRIEDCFNWDKIADAFLLSYRRVLSDQALCLDSDAAKA